MASYCEIRPTFPRRAIPDPIDLPCIERIRRAVCHVYGIPYGKLMAEDRHHTASEARQVTMWFLRKSLNMSYSEIGHECRRDHTTVMAAVRRIDRKRDLLPILSERISLVAGVLLGDPELIHAEQYRRNVIMVAMRAPQPCTTECATNSAQCVSVSSAGCAQGACQL